MGSEMCIRDSAVTADEVREVLQSYHYSVGYTLTAKGEGENV